MRLAREPIKPTTTAERGEIVKPALPGVVSSAPRAVSVVSALSVPVRVLMGLLVLKVVPAVGLAASLLLLPPPAVGGVNGTVTSRPGSSVV